LTSVSTISYAESNGVAFFSKYKAAQPKRNLRFAKVTVSMSKFFVKLFNFPFPQNAGLFMDNLGKIGRSLMDNAGGGGD
jgi:hypothetical protein